MLWPTSWWNYMKECLEGIPYHWTIEWWVFCCLASFRASAKEVLGALWLIELWEAHHASSYFCFSGIFCTGMARMLEVTLHGHCWTTTSGRMVIPSVSVWFMWTTRTAFFGIQNLLHIGSCASWKVQKRNMGKKIRHLCNIWFKVCISPSV